MRAIITIFMPLLSNLFFWLTLVSFNTAATEAINLYQQLYKTQQKATLTEVANANKIKEMLRNLKDIKPLAPLEIAPFHFQNDKHSTDKPNTDLKNLAQQSFCADCHSSTPHKKSVKTRSFLNMHSKTIACETCHFNPEQKITYLWQNNHAKLVDKINFEDKKNYLLVPVFQGIAINTTKNSNFAKNILQQWQENKKHITQKEQQIKQDSALSKQALLWQNIHQVLANSNVQGKSNTTDDQKSAQQTCTSCHQQSAPKLNLTALGASKQRQLSFEQNIIARFFSRYKKEDDKINLIELLK